MKMTRELNQKLLDRGYITLGEAINNDMKLIKDSLSKLKELNEGGEDGRSTRV